MATSVSKAGGVYVDLTQFHYLAVNFKAVEPALYKAMEKRLRVAGKLVGDEAKKNAAYSSEIAASIQVRAARLTVSIETPRINAKGSPIHAMEEFAKQGGEGGPGWDHPVFGNVIGAVHQLSHPYLFPALRTKGEEAALEIEAGVTEAIAESGLNG